MREGHRLECKNILGRGSGTRGAVTFSERTNWDREESALASAAQARRISGIPVVDLTASNPTRCGLSYDADALLSPLADRQALDYEPIPSGRLSARVAVARYYEQHGAAVAPENICLTTSTSEAYSFLFRLLCNPGDEVLIASPSYPLFDYLAALDDVCLVSYPLFYEHGWQIEPGALEARITARTRAIALVHPNNPTGHFVSAAERAAVETLCARHGLALLVDEVFLDYAWPESGSQQTFAQALGPDQPLTFVLSGLSKVAALPQMKLSWIVTAGTPALVKEANARLEVIADTFLSVNAPVQQALPAWLQGCAAMQQQIRNRVAENVALLDELLQATRASRLNAEGGWYAVLRYPAIDTNETFALELFERTGVLVYGGEAFGLPSSGWLVLSLLPAPEEFRLGVRLLLDSIERR